MRETERKISILKDEKFKELTKPVEAFITFEEEDGKIVGESFEAQYTFSGKRLPTETKILDQEFFLKESTEPTNIIWENMHFTPMDYYKRQALVFIAVALIVVVSFGFMFWFKQSTIKMFAKYPQVSCDNVLKSYHKEDGTGYSLLEKFAKKEFDDYYNPSEG